MKRTSSSRIIALCSLLLAVTMASCGQHPDDPSRPAWVGASGPPNAHEGQGGSDSAPWCQSSPILISRFGSTDRFPASFKHRSMAKDTISLGEVVCTRRKAGGTLACRCDGAPVETLMIPPGWGIDPLALEALRRMSASLDTLPMQHGLLHHIVAHRRIGSTEQPGQTCWSRSSCSR